MFRHSLKTDNIICTAKFTNILSSKVKEIRDHYDAQGGASLPFAVDIPSFWGSLAVVPNDSTYRYREPPDEEHFGVYNDITVSLLVTAGASGEIGVFNLVGEPAQLGALASFTSYAFTGTAPFVLDADVASPAVATSLILNAGSAGS